MPLDFPNAPALNDTWLASNDVTYRYDGFKWVVQPISGGTAYLPLTGGELSGPLVLPANALAPLQAVPLQQLSAAVAAVPPYVLPAATTTVRGGVRVDGTTVYMTGDVLSTVPTSAYLPIAGGTLTGGLHFGSVAMGSANDLSRHIDLYGGTYGLSITAGQLNYVAGSGASHVFWGAATWWGTINGGAWTAPGPIQSSNGRIIAAGASNPALTAYNTAGYAGGMWCESGGTLAFGWCDGSGNPNNTRMYVNRTGDFYVSGALTGTYMHSSGDVRGDGAVYGGGSAINGWGLYSAPYGGYWMGFNWDGTNVSCSANGGHVCTLVSSTWVSNNFATYTWTNNNFKPIGAYTPNQNVDVNNSPTFWDLTVGGTLNAGNAGANHYLSFLATQHLTVYNGNGIRYNAYSSVWVAFQWDGYGVYVFLNNGNYGYLTRSYDSAPYNRCAQHMLNGDVPAWYAWYGANNAGAVFWGINWSDRRLKANIRLATTDALDIVNRIQVHECDFTPPVPNPITKHHDCMLLSDEVVELIPRALIPAADENCFDGLHELPLIATLWRAVQQLTDRVKTLEAHA